MTEQQIMRRHYEDYCHHEQAAGVEPLTFDEWCFDQRVEMIEWSDADLLGKLSCTAAVYVLGHDASDEAVGRASRPIRDAMWDVVYGAAWEIESVVTTTEASRRAVRRMLRDIGIRLDTESPLAADVAVLTLDELAHRASVKVLGTKASAEKLRRAELAVGSELESLLCRILDNDVERQRWGDRGGPCGPDVRDTVEAVYRAIQKRFKYLDEPLSDLPMHLSEPWEIEPMGDPWVALSPEGPHGASIVLSEVGPHEGAQLRRAVDCVNACAGIADPAGAIAEARAALKLVKWRLEQRPGGDQLGQADGEAVADALRRLGGA